MSVKVLYIVGKGRSGTTLLDRILGHVPGVFSAGELRLFWRWCLVQGYPCSCGRTVEVCEVWSAVQARTTRLSPVARRPASEQAALVDDVLSWRRLPLLLASGRWPRVSDEVRDFVDLWGNLYDALASETGAEVIVDSSKWPAHPGILGLVPNIEPYVLQMVRDPRAVAYSYRRSKPTSGRQPPMPRFGAVHSAASWLARNVTAEITRATRSPSSLLRYEDLVQNVDREVRGILSLLGVKAASPLEGSTIDLETGHLVGGNPDRFRAGAVQIRADEEWRDGIAPMDRRLVTAVTLPLLQRYGYPVVPESTPQRRSTPHP